MIKCLLRKLNDFEFSSGTVLWTKQISRIKFVSVFCCESNQSDIFRMRVLTDASGKFDFRRRFRILLERWDSLPSRKKFLTLYNIPKTMFEMVGVRVYGDCNLNWYSNLGNFMIVYYVSMVAHTIYYFGRKGQLLFGTRCLCGMGIMISVIFLHFHVIHMEFPLLSSFLVSF